MKNKVLMITHMGQMIAQFNTDNIEILLNLGFEVHLAANFVSPHNTMTTDRLQQFCSEMEQKGVVVHQVDFERGTGTISTNIDVWRQLTKICVENDFSLIHCQSPLGGVFGRLLGHKFKIKVVYTAHGFHFFSGSPRTNWIIYYPIEKYLSKYTDTLVVINSEDLKIAKKFRKDIDVIKIPGIGINWDQINKRARNVNKFEERKKLGFSMDDFLLISVGELSDRKNQEIVIRAIAKLNNASVKYLIVGIGSNRSQLEELSTKLHVKNQIKFVGYREDVPELLGVSDLSVFPSKREGLGLAGIEAMAAGLPLVASNVNGILEYAQNGKNGFLCKPDDIDAFANAINNIMNSENIDEFSKFNIKESKKFDKKFAHEIMNKVYKKYM